MTSSRSQLILVLGAGGVGKTSCSASIGLGLAEKGLKCVVITIDPAKRLAQALGLESLSNEAQKIVSHENGGLMDALWLDNKSAFRELIYRKISTPKLAETILENRLFKIIQEQLGGIEEYLAVDKLLTLGSSGKYDVCILDTPPSRHALDFIESPEHLLKFFDESVLKLFLKDDSDETQKKNLWERFFTSTKQQTLEIFKKFLGKGFMGELSSLLTQSRPVHDSLRETAQGVKEWVRQKNTKSILVSLPEDYPLAEAHLLSSELRAHEIGKANLLIMNRVLPEASTPPYEECIKYLGQEAAINLIAKHDSQQRVIEGLEKILPQIAAAKIHLPPFSHSKMDLNLLRNLGKEILEKWQSQDQTYFSTNS